MQLAVRVNTDPVPLHLSKDLNFLVKKKDKIITQFRILLVLTFDLRQGLFESEKHVAEFYKHTTTPCILKN